jgi:hypothetical protein
MGGSGASREAACRREASAFDRPRAEGETTAVDHEVLPVGFPVFVPIRRSPLGFVALVNRRPAASRPLRAALRPEPPLSQSGPASRARA